ncbi:response regulator [Anaerolentibacter hominis]|uniref:response regulator n=1 Tax=Anaerolentibacter hominis TaxID=3079009 RepID=UPI0031B88E28
MTKQGAVKPKEKLICTALLVSVIIIIITILYVSAVRTQLWQQSIGAIRESTQQGCNTLQVQLQDEYGALEALAGYLSEYSSEQTDMLEGAVNAYGLVDSGFTLYLEEDTGFPVNAQMDETVTGMLKKSGQEKGLIDPHISSVTGVNVFDLYVRVELRDGSVGYLIKEYEVNEIVDSFSVSFYENTGFSYVVDSDGDVLIRVPHPNSNKTVKNLFDMLSAEQNNAEVLQQFADGLKNNKQGWAVLHYQNENTVFCYIPLQLSSDWYLISIIPQSVVNAQTNQILLQTFVLISGILLGIALLVILYFRNVNRINRRLLSQASYIEHLYNAVPEGIALLTVESPYSLLQLNQEGMRLLKYTIEESGEAPVGKNLLDAVIPEDYESISKIFQDTSDSGQKHTFEGRIIKEDRRFFWASGIVEKTLDENGTPVLIATFHDITDEKLAEEEAEREKLQERMMLVSAVSGIFPIIISLNLSTDTFKNIYMKPSPMVKLDVCGPYSKLYQDILSTVHPDFREEIRRRLAPKILSRTLNGDRQEVFLETKQMLLDGQYHWTSIQIIAVENPYSNEQIAILLSRHIDEQRYEEERQRQVLQSALDSAQAASLAKSQFLSNMSHDIRTPMNAIVGMTAIASAHVDEQERVRECLKKIGLSSQHLLSLINDILDMSKIESGKLSLREEPFHLAELIAEVGDLIRPQANAGKLELEIRLNLLGNERVIGDPLRIRQICLNILSNAVKYTPEGGKIIFDVYQKKTGRGQYRSYVFECRDNGIGMSAEFLEKLFQPFERAQDTTHSRTVGTGLGMAITKNIVDMMSGDIRVESEPGFGSSFTVTLPLKQQDGQKEEIPEKWIGVHSLIVDDDRQTCENAAALLRDMGLRAEFVTEGAAAVRLAAEAKNTPDPFELIIIDWKMPDLDGVEVTRRIRREVGTEVPVIILTAYDWEEIESEARNAGVTAFLSKPFYRTKICYLLSELGEGAAPLQQQTVALKSCFGGRHVLLVEDNLLNREIARTLIEEMGAEVEEACDGAEAVDKVSTSPEGYYDLILMDIQMPVMDGLEATKVIRSLKRQDAGTVPVIAMTANAFDEDVRAALSAGMTGHFAKPIDVYELEKLLERYLS